MLRDRCQVAAPQTAAINHLAIASTSNTGWQGAMQFEMVLRGGNPREIHGFERGQIVAVMPVTSDGLGRGDRTAAHFDGAAGTQVGSGLGDCMAISAPMKELVSSPLTTGRVQRSRGHGPAMNSVLRDRLWNDQRTRG